MMLSANNCQTSMKNRYFSNAPRNHKLEGVKNKTLCDDNSIYVLFKKSNFKVSARFLGGTGGKLKLNVEKWSFSQGLTKEFSRLSLTQNNAIFYTFTDQVQSPQSSKSTKKV